MTPRKIAAGVLILIAATVTVFITGAYKPLLRFSGATSPTANKVKIVSPSPTSLRTTPPPSPPPNAVNTIFGESSHPLVMPILNDWVGQQGDKGIEHFADLTMGCDADYADCPHITLVNTASSGAYVRQTYRKSPVESAAKQMCEKGYKLVPQPTSATVGGIPLAYYTPCKDVYIWYASSKDFLVMGAEGRGTRLGTSYLLSALFHAHWVK